MADKFPIKKHKITSSLDYNYWLKRFDIRINEQTNQNLLTVPKGFISTNIKC